MFEIYTDTDDLNWLARNAGESAVLLAEPRTREDARFTVDRLYMLYRDENLRIHENGVIIYRVRDKR